MYEKTVSRLCLTCGLVITAVLASSPLGMAQAYQLTNLVSDILGLAQNPPGGQPDAQLLNPWGLTASSTSPWWASDNNSGVSTLYNGQGVKQGLVVNIPSPVNGIAGTPTGVVFTGTSGFTFTAKGVTAGSAFTFVTEDGTIVAWGPAINPKDLPNDAFVVVDNSTNPTPTLVPGLGLVRSVATSANTAAAVGVDGSLWTWGSNESGGLGNSTKARPWRRWKRVGRSFSTLRIFVLVASRFTTPASIPLLCPTARRAPRSSIPKSLRVLLRSTCRRSTGICM